MRQRASSSSSMLRPVTTSTTGPSASMWGAPRARPPRPPPHGCRRRRTRRRLPRSPLRALRASRRPPRAATRRPRESQRGRRARRRSCRRGRSRPGPARHDSAITGAPAETTPIRRVSRRTGSERAADAREQRAVAHGHDDGGRRLAQLVDDLVADRRVAVELRRLGAVLEERKARPLRVGDGLLLRLVEVGAGLDELCRRGA